MQNTRKTRAISRKRYAILFAGFLGIALADLVGAPLIDRHAAAGKGYGHHAGVPGRATPGFKALRGPWRVWFNFRHALHWWTAWPARAGAHPVKLLTSDGNSMATNLAGHFGGSFVLALLALVLVPRPWLIAALGTVMNVFHEYVAEGRYCDPSFIDLWLDEFGLALAIGCFMFVRWRAMRKGGDSGSPPPRPVTAGAREER